MIFDLRGIRLSGRLLAAVCLATALETTIPQVASASDSEKLQFNRDIRPILSNSCFQCHGPDSAKREAGLRLDQREAAVAQTTSGVKPIVPGDHAASEIISRILSDDPDLKMPPPESGKTVTPEQLATLKRWVSEGAEYEAHWSFLPIQRPAVPAVKNDSRVRTPIDQFLQARLEKEGLSLADDADRVTLIRRVTFDLTGLPPTPAEVEAFVTDPAPDAYSKVVDRLLASPRYGEHMARYWLDAARYGDTHGLHLDNERSLWPYREWVINAYNNNLPFDQFTIDQLAGDLLPAPTLDQRVATGFNRCNVTTSEGGAIDAEWYVRYAIDRTDAVGTVWMGLTLTCASCHDHKFDPISQKEFYSLYAFFNSLSDRAMDGNALLPPPVLKLPTADQEARMAELNKEIATLKQQLVQMRKETPYVEPSLDAPADALTVTRRDYIWIDDVLPPGAQPQSNTGSWKFITAAEGPVLAGNLASTRTSEGLDQHFFTGASSPLAVGEGDELFAYVYLDPANPPKTIMLQFNDGAWEHRVYFGEDAIPYGKAGTVGHRHGGPLPPVGQWTRISVNAQHVGLASGSKLNGWAFTQFDGTVYWDKAGIRTLTLQNGESFTSLLAWENYQKQQKKPALPDNIAKLIKIESDKRNANQQKQIVEYFVEYVHPETRQLFEPLNGQIAKLQSEIDSVEKQIPATLVSEDMAQPREAFVLIRGAYDKPGEKVTRATPAALPPMPEDLPRNRLGLARWLVSREHPLTSRVTVNRIWQQVFGIGIVKSSNDFGSQAEWPTHPELLDWLASEFMESGWDQKKFLKLIVMSQAYRQSSKVTPALYAKDPENLWLGRGPRFRLDAETIRDSVLFTSGLLVERKGGKSVRPYQPSGIWEPVAFQSSNTRTYTPDQGESLFRRSLYTFWKRTAPPPSMTTFDAPSRETCTVRRARTNTPLQALALMNDDQYVEAARHLAGQMISQGGETAAERLNFACLRVLSRNAKADELAVLERVLEKQLEIYRADSKAAEELLNVGTLPKPGQMEAPELAAYTMVANLMLNLDAAITKE